MKSIKFENPKTGTEVVCINPLFVTKYYLNKVEKENHTEWLLVLDLTNTQEKCFTKVFTNEKEAKEAYDYVDACICSISSEK